MCHHHRSMHYRERHYRKHGPVSEKVKFFRHLRSYLSFNLVIAVLFILGGGAWGLWKASMIWGVFVAVHYIKAFGWPGANGWFGEDWEAWMEERERRRYEDGPEPLSQEPRRPDWREKDLV